jgi:hypothetical protein
MKRNGIVSLILKLAGMLIFLQVMTVAQEADRLIDKTSWRNEPIEVLGLKTRNRPIELGKKFAEDDDWLLGLTITVQNVSDKAIARIDIRLDFPRPGAAPPQKPRFTWPILFMAVSPLT